MTERDKVPIRMTKGQREFSPVVGGGGSEILLGGIFLPGKGNLRRSDFDDSNLFQS